MKACWWQQPWCEITQKPLGGREGSSKAIPACVLCVRFFKAMTWQLVTDYKMAGVHISMWLRQGHCCVGTKAAALHRNTHQLFSVCQCQHICLTMRLSSSLQLSHPCYRLTEGRAIFVFVSFHCMTPKSQTEQTCQNVTQAFLCH